MPLEMHASIHSDACVRVVEPDTAGAVLPVEDCPVASPALSLVDVVTMPDAARAIIATVPVALVNVALIQLTPAVSGEVFTAT
jgi:hypothetical protein